MLGFQKVKLKERQEAENMFKGKRGAQLAKDNARSTTFTPGAGLLTDKRKASRPQGHGSDQEPQSEQGRWRRWRGLRACCRKTRPRAESSEEAPATTNRPEGGDGRRHPPPRVLSSEQRAECPRGVGPGQGQGPAFERGTTVFCHQRGVPQHR